MRYASVSIDRARNIVVCLQDFYKLKNFVLISHCQTECDDLGEESESVYTRVRGKKIHTKLPLPLSTYIHIIIIILSLSHLISWTVRESREWVKKRGRKLAIQSLSSHFKRANSECEEVTKSDKCVCTEEHPQGWTFSCIQNFLLFIIFNIFFLLFSRAAQRGGAQNVYIWMREGAALNAMN